MRVVADAVEEGILDEFEVIEEQGGVLGAVERRYQRSQIQAAAHLLESQISSGERSIIGLNRYTDDENRWPNLEMIRTRREKKQLHLDRLDEFHRQHADQSERSLDGLTKVVKSDGNVFAELITTVEHCSLGQITNRLTEVVGQIPANGLGLSVTGCGLRVAGYKLRVTGSSCAFRCEKTCQPVTCNPQPATCNPQPVTCPCLRWQGRLKFASSIKVRSC